MLSEIKYFVNWVRRRNPEARCVGHALSRAKKDGDA
jgi:hypothetical protein